MESKRKKELVEQIEALQERLRETEETLEAIRRGQVDAIIVNGPNGEQVFTLKGADHTYRRLIEEMKQGALTMTPNGMILYCNKCMGEMIKLEIKNIPGTSMERLVASEDRTSLKELLKESKHGPSKKELCLETPDGMKLPVCLYVSPLVLDDRTILCAVVTDLTEQKQRQKLLQSEMLTRTIFEQASDGIVVCDASGRIIMANEMARKMCGRDPGGEFFDTAFPLRWTTGGDWSSEKLTGGDYADKPLLNRESIHGLEGTLTKAEGQELSLLVSSTPLLKEQKEVIGRLITLTDITEQKRVEKALRESEEKYRLLVALAADAILIAQDEEIKFSNPAAEKLTGYSADELSKIPVVDLIHPDDREMVVTRFKRTLSGEQAPTNYSFRIINKGGGERWVHINSTLVTWKEKPATLNFIRDITELKQTEEKLRESEKRFHDLFEHSYDAIIMHRKGRIIDVNQRACSLFGYPKEKLTGMAFAELCFDTSTESCQEQFETALREGSKRFEAQFVKKNGDIFEGEVSVRLVNPDEEIIEGIIRDITPRKDAERKIKEYSQELENMVEIRTKELRRALYDTEEARDRIDGILKSIGDGLIVTDLYHRVQLMNRAAEDLLGVRLSEVIDRSIEFAIKDENLRSKLIEALDRRESGYVFDFEIPEKNSRFPRIIRSRTSVIQDKMGKETGMITLFFDVTHEREIDRLKNEFISIAAHELRTPLTSIQGFSEILLKRDDLGEGEKKKFLSYINKQSVNLARIVNALLDISRIEAGKGLDLEMSPCDLNEIVRETVSCYQSFSEKHDFEVSLPEEPAELTVDRHKFRQVLENIITNAIKFSPKGGRIRVTGELKEDCYQVSVEDQGIGIPQDQAEKIFDKFYRIGHKDSSVPGSGLGMTIVKNLVEAHGGKVWVESDIGKGTTVRFTIPKEQSGREDKI